METHHCTIEMPYYVSFDNKDTIPVDILSRLKSITPYRFIIKPHESTETELSHMLTIVLSEEALLAALKIKEYVGRQLIIQQLVAHYGLQYKVYTIGEDFMTYYTKDSIPTDIGTNLMTFNSQNPFPESWKKMADTTDRLNSEFVKQVLRVVMNEIKLSVLGVDVVVEEHTNKYYVIDLNYFSSFRNMSEIASIMHPYLLGKYKGLIAKQGESNK
jgi:inositol-1,3,4-trisphosphate 5/6-kinase/inositol-tetrakisphosphate 1-kinase